MVVTSVNATRALARLAKQDDSIRAHDPKHIAAYQALRQSAGRINAASFMEFLETQETDVVQSAQVTTSFWLVPKALLPTPTPEILSAQVDEDSLQEQGAPAGSSVDFGAYFVIDKIVPRESLPKGTTEVSFSLGGCPQV